MALYLVSISLLFCFLDNYTTGRAEKSMDLCVCMRVCIRTVLCEFQIVILLKMSLSSIYGKDLGDQ